MFRGGCSCCRNGEFLQGCLNEICRKCGHIGKAHVYKDYLF